MTTYYRYKHNHWPGYGYIALDENSGGATYCLASTGTVIHKTRAEVQRNFERYVAAQVTGDNFFWDSLEELTDEHDKQKARAMLFGS